MMENKIYQVTFDYYRGEWVAKVFLGGVLVAEGRAYNMVSAVGDAFEKLGERDDCHSERQSAG